MDRVAQIRAAETRLKYEIDALRQSARENLYNIPELRRIEAELIQKLSELETLRQHLAEETPWERRVDDQYTLRKR